MYLELNHRQTYNGLDEYLNAISAKHVELKQKQNVNKLKWTLKKAKKKKQKYKINIETMFLKNKKQKKIGIRRCNL